MKFDRLFRAIFVLLLVASLVFSPVPDAAQYPSETAKDLVDSAPLTFR